MAAQPGQFLTGKRIIEAGGSFAGLAFVLALDQLWQSSTIDPLEVLLYEQGGYDEFLQKGPTCCA